MGLSVPAELHLVQHGEQLLTSSLRLQMRDDLGGEERVSEEWRGEEGERRKGVEEE